MSYEHILVPMDESPISYAALQHAEEIALKFGSKITVISVLALDPMIGVDFYQIAPSITEYVLAAEKNAQARINEVKETLLAHGIQQVNTKIVREVSPATGILNTLNEIGADLIIMGSHGRKGLKKFVLGSVAQEVLGESFVPVLIVKQ